MNYLGTAIGLGTDYARLSSFDRRDPSSYIAKGEGTGGLIGTGVGLLASPFLGPAGIMVGRQLGSMIGKGIGAKNAQKVIDGRNDRVENRMNMYEDLAAQNSSAAAMRRTESYLDSKANVGY